MKKILSSLARIILGVAVGLVLVFGGLAVLLRQPSLGTLPFPGEQRADPKQLRHHVEFLTEAIGPRDSGHPGELERAAAYIERYFRATGARVSSQRFTVDSSSYRNVIASFGPEEGQRLVVGAHYDSFGLFGLNPGADDNASGTAGLLELAVLLGRRAPSMRVDLVAYSTEEPPHFASPAMGSAIHAESIQDADVDLWGMICLEMIGYFSEHQSWPNWLYRWLYPNTGDFIAIAGRFDDRGISKLLKRSFRGAGDLPAYTFNGPDWMPGLDASDHRSYWALGHRAVIVSDTATIRNPHYHTEDDTADTLDYRRMAQVVDGVFSAVIHAAGVS